MAELLAGVFVEDEADAHPIHQMAGPKVNDTVTEASYLLPGLDIVHHKFLSLLLTNPVWSRADLVRAAGDRQIMLDGALERINEAALDFSGDVLIEGDDPIYVQLAVLENAQ